MDKKMILVVLTIVILLFPTATATNKIIRTNQQLKNPLFIYDSVLTLSYNAQDVNTAVFEPSGAPVSIPINISFRVIVPEIFMKNIAFRLIFLQTFIITNARVTLSVENPPDWAAISIANPDVYVSIDTTVQYAQTAIIITPHANAPSEGYTLVIKAHQDPLLNGHVLAKDVETNIQFQPKAVPRINIIADQTSIWTSPKKITIIPMNVTNIGNVQTLVTAQINTSLEGWNAYVIPSQIILQIKEKQPMTLVLTPPDDFEGLQTIQVLFNVSTYPSFPGESGDILPILISAFYIK